MEEVPWDRDDLAPSSWTQSPNRERESFRISITKQLDQIQKACMYVLPCWTKGRGGYRGFVCGRWWDGDLPSWWKIWRMSKVFSGGAYGYSAGVCCLSPSLRWGWVSGDRSEFRLCFFDWVWMWRWIDQSPPFSIILISTNLDPFFFPFFSQN